MAVRVWIDEDSVWSKLQTSSRGGYSSIGMLSSNLCSVLMIWMTLRGDSKWKIHGIGCLCLTPLDAVFRFTENSMTHIHAQILSSYISFGTCFKGLERGLAAAAPTKKKGTVNSFESAVTLHDISYIDHLMICQIGTNPLQDVRDDWLCVLS